MEKKVYSISLTENELLGIVDALYDASELHAPKYPVTSAYLLRLARLVYAKLCVARNECVMNV